MFSRDSSAQQEISARIIGVLLGAITVSWPPVSRAVDFSSAVLTKEYPCENHSLKACCNTTSEISMVNVSVNYWFSPESSCKLLQKISLHVVGVK
jgi:hypothetical protein